MAVIMELVCQVAQQVSETASLPESETDKAE